MTQLDLAKTEKRRSHVRPSLLALTAFFAATSLTPAIAHADGVDAAQVQALQEQIKQLQAEMDQLVANQVKVSAKPKVVYKKGKFSLSDGSGENTIAVTGRLHLDAGTYVADKRKSPFSSFNPNGGFNARRARIGVVGKVDGVWGYGADLLQRLPKHRDRVRLFGHVLLARRSDQLERHHVHGARKPGCHRDRYCRG